MLIRDFFFKFFFSVTISFVLIGLFSSCGEDVSSNSLNRFVVIIKADDLGDTTPNWNRFVKMVSDNGINAGIGIIAKNVTTEGSISEIKRISTILQPDTFPVIEFWNHGYDHSKVNGVQEFRRKEADFQLTHFQLSQEFFSKSLSFTCHTFGTPFNQSSFDTFLALEKFPEIHVWMCYQKLEKQYHKNWKDPKIKVINSFDEHIILSVDYLYVKGFPSEKIIDNYRNDRKKSYILIQIHPAGWNDESFGKFEQLIRFYKDGNRAIFMTPNQYYQYLHKKRTPKV